MLLTPRQKARFEKLIYLLFAFALSEAGDESIARALRAGMRLSAADVGDATQLLWGLAADPTLIDRFCQENPARLNKTDLREVASWKNGLYDEFLVCQMGPDNVYISGDVGFCVRRLDSDLKRYLPTLPAELTCTLLPFDGVITVAMVHAKRTLLTHVRPQKLTECLQKMKAEGRLARNARDFARLLPRAQAFAGGYEERRVQVLRDLTMNKLADFSEAGREKTQERAYELANCLYAFLTYRDSLTLKITDERTLEEVCLVFDDETLKVLSADLTEEGVTHTHAELARLAAQAELPTGYDPLRHAISESPSAIPAMRDIFEAGGVLTIPEADIEALYRVPTLLFPELICHRTDEGYTYVMPTEICALVADTDWDEAVRVNEAVGRVQHLLANACDYRGVVRYHDAVEEAMGLCGLDLDLKEILTIPDGRMDTSPGAHYLLRVDPDDPLLVAKHFLDAVGWDTEDPFAEKPLIDKLLEQQRDMAVRSLAELPDESVSDYLKGLQSWRTLEAAINMYLGGGPRRLDVLHDILTRFQDAYRLSEDVVRTFFQVLDNVCSTYGAKLPDEAYDALEPYAHALADDVPRWQLGGWSATDLRRA